MIDAHVHIWGPEVCDLPWLAGSGFPSKVSLDDVCAVPAAEPVEAFPASSGTVVLVTADALADEARREAEFFSHLASTDERVHGFVAGVDLTAADVEDHLDWLLTLPGVVGVRHNLQDVVNDLPIDPLVAGLDAVATTGFTFDACVRAHELPELGRVLARADPRLRVVLDHMGKPPVADHSGMWRWQREIGRLSQRENTWCKLSGLPAECGGPAMLEAVSRQVIDTCLDAFGPERCLIGSDRPISIDPHWTDRVLDRVDEPDHHLVLRDVATTVYRRLA